MTAEENLKRLSDLAKAATPGPWKIGYNDGSGSYDEEAGTFVLSGDESQDIGCVLHARLADSVFDANYISAANPQTLLTLIEVIRIQNEVMKELLLPYEVIPPKMPGFAGLVLRAALTEVDRRLGELK